MVREAFIILENVRSAHNVGAIFRTAEAIGISKIFLGGYTPAPIDRFGRKQPEVAKAALGAELMVPWEKIEDVSVLIARLKEKDTRIITVERSDAAIDYKTCPLGNSVAFIFGNEIDGVESETIASSDAVIALPMKGRKESLNVATTVGIVLYRLLDV